MCVPAGGHRMPCFLCLMPYFTESFTEPGLRLPSDLPLSAQPSTLGLYTTVLGFLREFWRSEIRPSCSLPFSTEPSPYLVLSFRKLPAFSCLLCCLPWVAQAQVSVPPGCCVSYFCVDVTRAWKQQLKDLFWLLSSGDTGSTTHALPERRSVVCCCCLLLRVLFVSPQWVWISGLLDGYVLGIDGTVLNILDTPKLYAWKRFECSFCIVRIVRGWLCR